MDYLQFFLVLIMVPLTSGALQRGRTKRIIFGRIILDRQLYTAVDYYVWIREPHHCGYVYGHAFYSTRNTHPCPPLPKFLKCGGVLLTPTVVQTACHCLAVFIHEEGQLFSRAKEQKTWEKMYLVYPGWNDVGQMNVGLLASRYYVHSKCSEVNWEKTAGQRGMTQIRFTLHNYGLIVTKESVENYEQIGNRFSFAPLYTQLGITQMWRETQTKEYTCLFFGFGNYNRIKTETKTILEEEQSTHMRFGWRIVTNYYDCYDFTYPADVRRSFPFDYKENATWSCAVSHNRTTDTFLAQGGDSGGPVTCSGEYFGIIGEPSNITANPAVTIISPIAFTVYENARKFRAKFMKFIERAANADNYPAKPKYDPVNPRPRYYSMKSKSTSLENHTHYALTILFVIQLSFQ